MDSGTYCPVLRQYALIRSGIFPAATKSGASGSIKQENGFAFRARVSISANERLSPSFCHCRRVSCISQRPIIFLRKDAFPPYPPSFVTLQRSVFSFMRGSESSVPSSDHVPQLRKMKSSFRWERLPLRTVYHDLQPQ